MVASSIFQTRWWHQLALRLRQGLEINESNWPEKEGKAKLEIEKDKPYRQPAQIGSRRLVSRQQQTQIINSLTNFHRLAAASWRFELVRQADEATS